MTFLLVYSRPLLKSPRADFSPGSDLGTPKSSFSVFVSRFSGIVADLRTPKSCVYKFSGVTIYTLLRSVAILAQALWLKGGWREPLLFSRFATTS